MKSYAPNVLKQAEAKRNGVINPKNTTSSDTHHVEIQIETSIKIYTPY